MKHETCVYTSTFVSETTFQKQSVLNYIKVFHLINSVFQNKEASKS